MPKSSAQFKQPVLLIAFGFCLFASANYYEFHLGSDLHRLVEISDILQTKELEVQRAVFRLMDLVAVQRAMIVSPSAEDGALYRKASDATLRGLLALKRVEPLPLPLPPSLPVPHDIEAIDDNIKALEGSIVAKMAELERVKAVADAGDTALALSMLNGEDARDTWSRIRAAALDIQDRLAVSTSALVDATSVMTRRDSLADLLGLLIGLPLFGLAVFGLYREGQALYRSEEKLLISTAAAEAASESKSAFLATMSHEIRTPLGVVLGYADMLASQNLPREVQGYAECIQRNGKILLALVNDILDLAKVESGKIDVERTVVQVVPYFRELTAQFQERAAEKGLRLTCVVEGHVPEAIRTDGLRFRQVLTNMLGNAIKFTEHGSVSMAVRLVMQRGDASPSLLQVTIQDTGLGIAPENRVRIFEPFTQAAAYITRKFGGTGLGLSLARKLARELGGDLELVQSDIGVGSTFTATVDTGDLRGIHLLDQVAVDAYAARLHPTEQRSVGKSSLAGTSLLVVEDFLDNQLMIKTILAHSGASVDVASNGQEGVTMALARRYDLILMDIQMPILNGYRAVAKLRQTGYDRPIAALTAEAMKGEWERCLAAGFDDYLAKPINRVDLISLVQRHTRGRVADVGARQDASSRQDRAPPEPKH